MGKRQVRNGNWTVEQVGLDAIGACKVDAEFRERGWVTRREFRAAYGDWIVKIWRENRSYKYGGGR